MRHPEEIVGLFSYAWMCKNKYEHNYDVKDYAGQAGKRLKEPKVDARSLISSESHLLGHTV